jgi:hypothetical protein
LRHLKNADLKNRRQNLSGILLLGIFLQALMLASVHRHAFNPSEYHFSVADNGSGHSIDDESESQHCYVCDFLTTVQLYASAGYQAAIVSFEVPQSVELRQDLSLRQIQSFSTRAPPIVFC